MMEITNTLHSGMCRCCASEGTFKDIKTKYHWMGEEEVYADMLTDCFDIKICTPEDLDNGICEVCITQLRNAANFKKQVLHTEEQFKRRLQLKDVKNPIKLESVDEDPIESDHVSDPDFSGTEYEVPIKQEVDEKPKPRKRPAKATTSRAKKPKVEPESSKKRVQRGTGIITIDAPQKGTVTLVASGPNLLRVRRSLDPAQENSRKNQHNLRQILLYSNATPIRWFDQRGYSCAFCPKIAPEPRALKKHFLNDHNDKLIKSMTGSLFNHVVKIDITSLNCALCDTDFADINTFMTHLKRGHQKDLYMDVKSQILPFKFETAELRCAICSTEYASFKLLQQHMNVHFRNYVCQICNAAFVMERLLRNHMTRHGDGEFKCGICSKSFINETKRREHERRSHMGFNKRNICKLCDERFADYREKMNHLVKVHGAPPAVFKCQACERTFGNQRAMSQHVRKDHLMERKHQCDHCDMKFFTKSRLQNHMPKHTGIKKFQCDFCSKAYGTKNTLKEHIRIHTGDKRFSCSHCGQAFTQKCSLKGHLRSKHSEFV